MKYIESGKAAKAAVGPLDTKQIKRKLQGELEIAERVGELFVSIFPKEDIWLTLTIAVIGQDWAMCQAEVSRD